MLNMFTMYKIQFVLGLFGIFAFIIVGVLLKRYQLEQGPWLILSLVTLCLTLGLFLQSDVFITSAMALIALLALVKFYDIMRMTQ